jgi:Synergist-CTERM protein sorting domain-containing protein
MKKLSCFALVVALVLAAGAAFALPNSEYSKLAPYNATEYDMFTIQGSFDVVSGSVNDVNHGWNKWIASADIAGLFFYGVPGSFDVFAFQTAHGTVSADWLKETANYGTATAVLGSTGTGSIESGDWIPLLVRTTKAATQNSPVSIPIYMVASNDATFGDTYFPLLSYDVTAPANHGGYAYACEVPCCGVNFYIDCCTPSDYSKIVKNHELQVWFDDEEKFAVYCCPGLQFGFVSGDGGLIASKDIPVTVAHLNPDENMVRVRVARNFRYATATSPYSSEYYKQSWFSYLAWGSYSATKVCEAGALEFWPVKEDASCQPTVDGTKSVFVPNAATEGYNRYWWKANGATGVVDPEGVAFATAAFFKDKDVWEVADVRLGETLNLGVWYGGAEFGNCVCDSLPKCTTSADYVVPRINIQNLGTDKLDVTECHADPASFGICSSDCGLCDTLPEYYKDSMKTGEVKIGTTDYTKFYSGIYTASLGVKGGYVDAAFRWGDFFYASNSTTKNDIITYDCPCYIYPAFTKTIQPMANKDFSFSFKDGAESVIAGRWNTSYYTHKLKTSGASLCGVDDCSFLFVYTPCGCEPTNVTNTIEKQEGMSSLIGQTFAVVSPVNSGAAGLKLDGARIVVNPTSDDATGVADLKAAEGDNLVWYNFFKVFEWDHTKNLKATSTKFGILPVQLRFEISKAQAVSDDIDVSKAGWRSTIWGDGTTGKYTLKARNADGTVSDILSDLANAKEVLDYRSFITCDKDEIKTDGHVTDWTKLTVFLTVFVIDAPSPDGKAFHYYKNDTTGDYILFVFDGKHDDTYQDILYVAKPSTTCTFNVTGTKSFLVGESTTLTANCLGDCVGLLWTLASTDVAEISGDATTASVVVKGLAAGTTTIHVDACSNSADVTLTVTTPTLTPTPTTGGGSSSGGGCNAGAFAPLALLLIAPVVFLLKK